MDIALSHVVNVALTLAAPGLSNFNASNLAIFTDEVPNPAYTNGPGGTPGFGIYYSSTAVGKDFGTGSKTYAQAVSVFAQQPNILSGGGYLVVIPMVLSGGVLNETLTAALLRAFPLVQFFGVLCNAVIVNSDWITAQAWVQTQNLVVGRASYSAADLTASSGNLWAVMNAGDSHTRGFYYGNLGTLNDANSALAAFMSRAMSVDFSASNTANTAAIKQLAGVLADASMTETIYAAAQIAGAATYQGIQGVAAVEDSNANGGFFDEIYNLGWFSGALQVAGFNVLRQTGTKVAQTDGGVETLMGAYRRVIQQGRTAGYFAPGAWTSPDTFGNPDDFRRNIQEQGYYIYAPPVAQQSQADRAARKSPTIQIAVKEAGAIHSSNILVNVNA